MTRDEAKQILVLYRPGTADAADPDFADALGLCARDPELKGWFDEHCAVYTALRAKFKQAPPEGLKEQILSERKVQTSFLAHPAVVASVAVGVIIAALVTFWPGSREKTDFPGFQTRMVSTALRTYGMEVKTDDPAKVVAYMAQKNRHTDIVLPEGLRQNAITVGGATLKWQNNPVSMLCFRTGQPLPQGQETDLWLFVIDTTSVENAPASAQPQIAQTGDVTTATWKVGNKAYMLAVKGDEKLLRKFL